MADQCIDTRSRVGRPAYWECRANGHAFKEHPKHTKETPHYVCERCKKQWKPDW